LSHIITFPFSKRSFLNLFLDANF